MKLHQLPGCKHSDHLEIQLVFRQQSAKMAMNKFFHYTHPMGTLTLPQRQFYEDNGYLIVRNLVEHELLDCVNQRFIDIVEDKVKYFAIIVMTNPDLKRKGAKGEHLVTKIQDWLHDETLFQYCVHPGVTEIVASIVGPDVTAVHTMFINKPPNSSVDASRHPIHQDMHYFPFRPINRICGTWTACEDVDETNGCLFVVPGSHTTKLMSHDYPHGFKDNLYHGIMNIDHLPRSHIEMKKGDTIFFHPLLMHGSGPNMSKGFRKAISTHYANSNCYFVDLRGTTQEGVCLGSEAVALKKGLPITFVQYWKGKSRLIRGKPGNFQKMNPRM